jgi:hypothetical protein
MKVYFESIAQAELSKLANDDEISGVEQYGFRLGKGTSACIIKLLDKWISKR